MDKVYSNSALTIAAIDAFDTLDEGNIHRPASDVSRTEMAPKGIIGHTWMGGTGTGASRRILSLTDHGIF